MELLIFRLVQECLTNIHRHSGSKTAQIEIAREGENVRVAVQDQGAGMSPQRLAEIQSHGTGVGIRGMRERGQPIYASVPLNARHTGDQSQTQQEVA